MIKDFSLDAQPTFKAKPEIPVPGKKPVKIEFTFRHRDADDFKTFIEGVSSHPNDTALVMDVACGWELDQPFDEEHVGKLVRNYMGSAKSIVEKYIEENAGARLGNFAN